MIAEEYSEEAQHLLIEMHNGEADLLAPTILKIEAANALNTYTRRRGVDLRDANPSPSLGRARVHLGLLPAQGLCWHRKILRPKKPGG